MNRRTFSSKIAKGALLLPWLSNHLVKSTATRQLDVLVLGGTYFVGPSIVKALTQAGHKVTLFNRGITNPTLFPELPLIKGDRTQGDQGYSEIIAQQKKWDAIIDVWPQETYLVEEATQLLSELTSHYLYISSIAVYGNFSSPGIDESSPTVDLTKDKSDWMYPEHKSASEEIVRGRFPNGHTILRCGAIKGWRDDAIDLAYWLTKIKQGKVMAPPKTDVLQFIDVHDVGRFVNLSIEQKLIGTYNVNGPKKTPISWEELMGSFKEAINPLAEVKFASKDFLKEHEIREWDDLPFWLPEEIDPGFFRIDVSKSIQAGMEYTPLAQTAKEALEWYEKEILPAQGSVFGQNGNVGLTKETHDRVFSQLKN